MSPRPCPAGYGREARPLQRWRTVQIPVPRPAKRRQQLKLAPSAQKPLRLISHNDLMSAFGAKRKWAGRQSPLPRSTMTRFGSGVCIAAVETMLIM